MRVRAPVFRLALMLEGQLVAPDQRGFGARFLERGVAREFDGTVTLDFAPDGVCCTMRMPLSVKLRMAA